MGLIGTILKTGFYILIFVSLFLVICHFLRFEPWCLITDYIIAGIASYDTSNIIPSGGIEFGAITGGLSVATAGWGMFKKKVTELTKYRQKAESTINNLSGSYKEMEGTVLQQEQTIKDNESKLTEQINLTTSAETAKAEAESKLSSIEKENEKLREQLNTLNNICSDAKVKADNLENLPIIKQVI